MGNDGMHEGPAAYTMTLWFQVVPSSDSEWQLQFHGGYGPYVPKQD